MGCAIQVVKYLVFIANFIFVLCGIALLSVGIIYKLDINVIIKAVPEQYSNIGVAPVFTIVVGAIIFIVSFFGCCGAIKENVCFLNTYAAILLAILILQIAIAVVAFLSVKNYDDNVDPPLDVSISKEMEKIFDKYFDQESSSRETVDAIQESFKCCGVDGPTYWTGKPRIPGTCCEKQSSEKCATGEAHKSGCAKEVYDVLIKTMHITGYVLIGIAVVEVVGVIFGLCLASSIKNHRRRGGYA